MLSEERKIKSIKARKERYSKDPKFREKMRKYRRKRYAENSKIREQKSTYHKKWASKLENKEYHKLYVKKRYYSDLKFREKHAANAAKRRRELGFKPINPPFERCCGHHVDKNNVINVPEELHTSVQHKQSNNKQMEQINILAWTFMESNSY